MSEFQANSVWNKWAFLSSHLAFALMLFAFLFPGWPSFKCLVTDDDNCKDQAVEFLMVAGYICLLVAVVLTECLNLLDEVRGNKPALIAFIVLAFIAGLCIMVGDGYFIHYREDAYIYSNTDTMVTGIMAVLGGVFGLLEVCGVSSR